jgi:hypothetical protein
VHQDDFALERLCQMNCRLDYFQSDVGKIDWYENCLHDGLLPTFEAQIELQDTSVLSPKYHVFYCDQCAINVRRSPFVVRRVEGSAKGSNGGSEDLELIDPSCAE